jgi:hypothetical protein
MEQGPSWEANNQSANQEIPRLSWNPNVHYRFHEKPPPAPILSHVNPVHTSPLLFPIILHLGLRLPSGLFPSVFPIKIFYAFLISHMIATYPAHLLHLNFINVIIFSKAYKLWSSSMYRFSSLLSLPPSYIQIFSSTSFSNTINLCSSVCPNFKPIRNNR